MIDEWCGGFCGCTYVGFDYRPSDSVFDGMKPPLLTVSIYTETYQFDIPV